MNTSINTLTAQRPELGAFIVRLALGVVIIAHSIYLKLMVFSLPGTAQFFASLGLPAFTAYLVFTVEAVAGLMLLVGYKTRWASLALIPVLLGATWVHWSSGWLFSNTGGGWEYPLFLAAIAAGQNFLGNGSFAIENAKAKA